MDDMPEEKVRQLGNLLSSALPEDHDFVLMVFTKPLAEKRSSFFITSAGPETFIPEMQSFLESFDINYVIRKEPN